MLSRPACATAEAPSTAHGEVSRSVWSEGSPTVRVPKAVLGQLGLQSLVMTNYETARTLVLAKPFIATFLVTETEAQRVNDALARALHKYRSVESQHLERTSSETTSLTGNPPHAIGAPPGPPTVESVAFKLRPFPKEAAAIRWELQREILATLGTQRATLFWDYSYLMLQSVMGMFTREEPAALGARSLAISASNQSRNAPAEPAALEAPLADPREEVFHTFFLRGAAPVPRVDMDETRRSRSIDGRFMGGGSGGGPYSEALDVYVPVDFKPTLARWRKMIREGTVPGALGLKAPSRQDPGPEEWKLREDAGEAVAPAIGDPVFNHAAWEERAADVEFQKVAVGKLPLLLFTPEGKLTMEAGNLYGMSLEEQRGVGELFQDMETQMRSLELIHFEKMATAQLAFVLKAFPEQADQLEQEWLKRLSKRIGPERAGMINQALRQPVPRGFRRGEDVQLRMGHLDAGPQWFLRGRETMEFKINGAPGGRWEVEFNDKSEAGRGGRFSGNWGKPPQRFRHLLTTEVLDTKMRPETSK